MAFMAACAASLAKYLMNPKLRRVTVQIQTAIDASTDTHTRETERERSTDFLPGRRRMVSMGPKRAKALSRSCSSVPFGRSPTYIVVG
jgi:hypothetical protein